jgi:hypothetical protein
MSNIKSEEAAKYVENPKAGINFFQLKDGSK